MRTSSSDSQADSSVESVLENGAPLVVSRVSCGRSHSAAVLSNGGILTWGRAEDGQLGHGQPDELLRPTAVSTLCKDTVAAASCGTEYTIALIRDTGAVWSWGWYAPPDQSKGDFGRLGHDAIDDVFIPKQISGLIDKQICQVACGDAHTCALSSSGQVYTFGRGANGQLGLGTNIDCHKPALVSSLQGMRVTRLASGAEHSMAITADGAVFSWGWGRYGCIGDGGFQDRWQPTEVILPEEAGKIVKVAAGWRHSLCVDTSGTIFSWGFNRYGQCGNGNHQDQPLPKAIEELRGYNMTIVAGGWRHSMAADQTGHLYGWGWNQFGQLGLGMSADVSIPARVASTLPEEIADLACGWRHTLAVTTSGKVMSWGRGYEGQLGHGDTQDSLVPRVLKLLSVGTMDEEALLGDD